MSIQPFKISISPFVIQDLRERLGRARWPDENAGSGWAYGANKDYLQHLCTHWGHGFDWKEQEQQLNAYHHFKADVDGFGLHFIHEKGKGANSIPILLIHGYPDSFVRFMKLIPLLTQPGPDGLSFDVIVPSIPGYGFSDKPVGPGMNAARVADIFARLMKEELGYQTFIAHGGDWGSSISAQLALKFPNLLLGLHLTDIPARNLVNWKELQDLTRVEKDYLETGRQWYNAEGAYGMLQGTKPQTLAYAVNDSPVGLAAWIIEKFYAWTDHKGDLESVYTMDELLTNLTVYWVTQTAGSAFRIYYESMHHPPKMTSGKIGVPAGFCIGPKDLVPPPRELAERIFNVHSWTTLPSGGHFMAMEKPRELAGDIFSFATTVAPQGHAARASRAH